MIVAGESLGTRYAVSTAPDENRAGVLFEVVDRSSTVVLGQLLAENSVTPAQVAEVRAELSAVPGLPTLVRPREIALSARSLPVGILDRPGVVSLRSRVAALAEAQGKRPFAVNLLRWVASISADLSVAHQAGALHGAISSRVLVSNPRTDTEACLLAGFGIGGFAKRTGTPPPGSEPSKRKDLTDLLGALHDLFLVAGVQPEGSAAAKWTLLRHSAMHGEHPALASGTALATALNEIASLPDDADARPTGRNPTIAPPPRPAGRSTTLTGSTRSVTGSHAAGGRRTTGDGTRQRAPSERPSAPARPTPPRFSPVIVGAGILAIVAVAGGVGFVLWKTQREASDGAAPPAVHVPTQAPHAGNGAIVCPGEITQPLQALRPEGGAQEYDGTCSGGPGNNSTPWLTVVARAGTTVTAAIRPAQRGQHFGAPLTLGNGAVELGSTLGLPDATWVAWRNGVGVPVALARVEGHGALPVAVGLSGWDAVPLRGAMLLHATTRDVYLVTNVESESGAHPVLLDVALPPTGGRPAVTTWYLGAGVVDAVIPGETPTLLLHGRTPGHHELSAVTLRLAALSAARPTGEPATVRGSPLPETAVDRTSPVSFESEALAAAPHGAGPARSFLVTTGPSRTTAQCSTPGRCVGAGTVSLVSFPPGAPPATRELARNAWAEDLLGTQGVGTGASAGTGAGEGEGLRAMYILATPSGAPVNVHTEVTLATAAAEPLRAAATSLGNAHVRLAQCGAEPWLIFDSAAEPPGIAALPLACLHPAR